MFPPPRKTFSTNFICRACGHNFRREIPRIYIHMPDFERLATEKKPAKRSPYVIPQHITCPQCNRVDDYELAPQTTSMLMLTVVAGTMAGSLVKGHPVQLIAFGLHDGTIMHPLDALEHYRTRLARTPDDLATRMRYANILRTLGWLEEAQEQYQAILAVDPDQLEAWLGLTSVHIGGKHPGAAKKTLKELQKRAPGSQDPQRQDYESQARTYLEGIYPLEDLTPDSLLLHSTIKTGPSKRPLHKKRRNT